jgi:hypothetical protein
MGSSLAMSFSAPVGYTTVAADTMVAVHSLDGAAVISYQCQSNTDVLVVSMALTHMIAKRLKVPKLCINLVWGSMETKQVIVTFNLTPLSQASYFRLDLALRPNDCELCGEPVTGRLILDGGYKCDRCPLMACCDECRFGIEDGLYSCLFCVHNIDEFDTMSFSLQRRCKLLLPDYIACMREKCQRAMFHWELFVNNTNRLRLRRSGSMLHHSAKLGCFLVV